MPSFACQADSLRRTRGMPRGEAVQELPPLDTACHACAIMEALLWQVTKTEGRLHMRSVFPKCQVKAHFGKTATRAQLQAAFLLGREPVLPLQPSGRVSVARQKSPAPRKDNRIGTTNRSVPASVEGLAQACLIGDRPQSRHPDESTRPAHLVCGVAEEHPRWRMNLKQGHPGKLCPDGLDKGQSV